MTLLACFVTDRYNPELRSVTGIGGTAVTFLKLLFDVVNRK